MTEHVIEDIVDWNYGEDEELTPRLPGSVQARTPWAQRS
jgi:hypothetical protein